jgi:hypothetical protein
VRRLVLHCQAFQNPITTLRAILAVFEIQHYRAFVLATWANHVGYRVVDTPFSGAFRNQELVSRLIAEAYPRRLLLMVGFRLTQYFVQHNKLANSWAPRAFGWQCELGQAHFAQDAAFSFMMRVPAKEFKIAQVTFAVLAHTHPLLQKIVMPQILKCLSLANHGTGGGRYGQRTNPPM